MTSATDNRMTKTATSRIITTLRERNVQFATHGNTDRVWWTAENGVTWYAQDRPSANELFVKLEAVLTPDKAIAATLGAQTAGVAEKIEELRRTSLAFSPNIRRKVNIALSGIEQAIADELNSRAERTCRETEIDKFFRGCSECGYMWEYMYGIGRRVGPNYCPNCGARVRGGGE